MFEQGARAHPPRALYRSYLAQSDVFVGIYWQRYGWVAPDMEISGLEDEYVLSSGMPRLLYVKRPAPDIEPGLQGLLRRMQAEDTVSYKPFRDAGELRGLVVGDLALLLSERFDGAGRPGAGGAPASRSLPIPTTRLVGRDADVQAIGSLLDSGHRLVTLTGPGGVGKTRLAVGAAGRDPHRWPAGVWFVDLSSLTDPEQVATAIATALNVTEEGSEQPLDAVVRRLASGRALLVLDNFEQVAAAAPTVAALLQRCAELQLMVTSRVALRIRGEQEFRVRTLDVDDHEGIGLEGAPAVQLFLERAGDVRPGFTAGDHEILTVAEICRRLDGLPLALELAAAQLRLLTPAQLAARLDERLEVVTGYADLPERQRTLRATIEWSHDLLPEQARRVFARLALFSGPFTLEAADEVAGWDGVDVLDSLAALVDHSLLSPAQRPDGEPAHRMLDTIRAHARRRLEQSGELDRTFEAMDAHLAGVYHATAPRLHTAEQARALLTLDGYVGDLATTLGWLLEHGRPVGRLLQGLSECWVWSQIRGQLRRVPDMEPIVRATAARVPGGDLDLATLSHLQMGRLFTMGSYPRVVSFVDEFLPALRPLAPQMRAMAVVVRAVSRPYVAGGPARRELEEAASSIAQLDDPAIQGYALSHLGDALLLDGDVAGARDAHVHALGLGEATGDVNLQAEARYHLALDALAGGEPATAREQLPMATAHYSSLDHRDGLSRCLMAAAWLHAEEGDLAGAARLTGTAAAVREPIDMAPWPMVAELESRVVARLRSSLSAEELAGHARDGRREDPVAALAEALAGGPRSVSATPD